MSRYDSWIAVYRNEARAMTISVKNALADIDARLAKLEASEIDRLKREFFAFTPGSSNSCGNPPTQPQREPGWYPVWSKRTGHLQTYWFDGTQWRERPGHIGLVDLPSRYEDGFTIGPRIQPPEGAV